MKRKRIKENQPYVIMQADEEVSRINITCCDCGLTHNILFEKAVDGEIVRYVTRDDRATGQIRRHGTPGLMNIKSKIYMMKRRRKA